MTTDPPSVVVHLVMHDDSPDDFLLRQPILGTSPYVLIEFDLDDDAAAVDDDDDVDGLVVKIVTGGGFDQDVKRLATLLRQLADGLQAHSHEVRPVERD